MRGYDYSVLTRQCLCFSVLAPSPHVPCTRVTLTFITRQHNTTQHNTTQHTHLPKALTPHTHAEQPYSSPSPYPLHGPNNPQILYHIPTSWNTRRWALILSNSSPQSCKFDSVIERSGVLDSYLYFRMTIRSGFFLHKAGAAVFWSCFSPSPAVCS
jgi:hypothetical protein